MLCPTLWVHFSHCPAGIFKNIISNVTKNEEARHGPVPCPLSVLWEGEGETPSLYSTCDSLRLCRKLTQDQGKNSISQHLMSAFTKRCCKFALANWIRGISKHPTSVKNNLHFRSFLPKSLHNPNKCLTFAAREPAKPLNDAQPTTNREQCQTCLNIAEVRRRKRFLEAQMCGSFFYMYL